MDASEALVREVQNVLPAAVQINQVSVVADLLVNESIVNVEVSDSVITLIKCQCSGRRNNYFSCHCNSLHFFIILSYP